MYSTVCIAFQPLGTPVAKGVGRDDDDDDDTSRVRFNRTFERTPPRLLKGSQTCNGKAKGISHCISCQMFIITHSTSLLDKGRVGFVKRCGHAICTGDQDPPFRGVPRVVGIAHACSV